MFLFINFKNNCYLNCSTVQILFQNLDFHRHLWKNLTILELYGNVCQQKGSKNEQLQISTLDQEFSVNSKMQFEFQRQSCILNITDVPL